MASADTEEMKIDSQRAKVLTNNIASILSTIQSIKPKHTPSHPPRLIAVSKLKPASDVLALVQSPSPHLHFGENYLQELQHKASILPQSIKWSFIGALQTNKCVPLAQIPNLWAVNSIDTVKKANALEKGRKEWSESDEGTKALKDGAEEVQKQIRVFVQVNTSGEESKSGAKPGEETVALGKHIQENTPHLKLQGVMTIGAIARSQASGKGEANEDFMILREERARLEKELGLEEGCLELSMGMSGDFTEALEMGSAEVRVGGGIFGERPLKRQPEKEVEEGAK